MEPYKNVEETKEDTIDKKLSNVPPPELEDILIEEDLVDKLIYKDEKLLNYLTQERIKKMLDYIIKEPKEDDYNKGHKFPFVCSKIFNLSNKKIMNYFFKSNQELIKESNELINNPQFQKKKYGNLKRGCDDEIFDMEDELKIEDVNDNEDEIKEDNNDKYDQVVINEPKYDNNDEVNMRDIDDEVNIKDDKDMNLVDNNDDDDVIIIQKNDENNHLEDNNIDKIKENLNDKKNDNDKNENIKENNDEDNDEIVMTDNIIINDLIKEKNNLETEKKETDLSMGNKKDYYSYETIESNENFILTEKLDENYPQNRIELLDYLLKFLSNDSELNYILCGYFQTIMINLISDNPLVMIKYIYLERKDILRRFVYHSYRKSISEILCKLLKYEESLEEVSKDKYNEEELSSIRFEIIVDIFNNIDIKMNNEKLYSLEYTINELSKSGILGKMYENKNIVESLIIKPLKDINLNDDSDDSFNVKNNFIIIIDIIIYWIKNILSSELTIPTLLSDMECIEEKQNNEVNHTIISKALFVILPNLIKVNFNSENKDNKLKPLGLYRIKIIELLRQLIPYYSSIPNEFDNLLIENYFFENAINYVFIYPLNNLYQEALYQFFKDLLEYKKGTPYHEKAAEYLFNKINIIDKIKSNFNLKNSKNEGNTGIGFIPFLVRLSYKINAIIGGEYLNLETMKEGSINFINEQPNNNRRNRYLGYFKRMQTQNEKKKEVINPVEFMKKFYNEDWNHFFKENIMPKIKRYEEKYCQQKNKYPDLFDGSSEDDNNDIFIIKGNKRYGNVNDIEDKVYEIKDLEININEINIEKNKSSNQDEKEDKPDDSYNTFNFWKKSLEDDNNSYFNAIGKEALDDLLE